jgi:mono/diheme cytochrome c family protein
MSAQRTALLLTTSLCVLAWASAPLSAQPNVDNVEACDVWRSPLPFGGAAHAEATLAEVKRWRALRGAREELRLLEALEPRATQARLRLEREMLLKGCVSTEELIDLGRALFLRRWRREEGYGSRAPTRPTKLQKGSFGGPDAGACVDCHWKGGFAGGGDRVDNAYVLGDGEHLSAHEPRNPLALWGSGWVELIAREMSAELHAQRASAIKQAQHTQQPVSVELESKGTSFGTLTAHPNGSLDVSEVEGVDADLTLKPFGWKGVFRTLRDFVEVSAHKHFTLQAERLVAHPPPEVTLSPTPAPHPLDPQDPDGDGVTRELTNGQVDALVAFLATLDAPLFEVPHRSIVREPIMLGEAKEVAAPEFALKWQAGAKLFDEVGCAGCHTPLMPLNSDAYPVIEGEGGALYTLKLSVSAGRPHPEREGGREGGRYLVPVFSDFKRHDMGERLKGKGSERGVGARFYLTRRLWGSAQTAPYLHTGAALTLEEVVYQHGGDGSEAAFASESFFELSEADRASLRLFLSSLSRAQAVRVR